MDEAIIAGKYSKRVNRGMLLWNALTEKLSYVQTDATTPNIVGPRMLGVLVSVLAAVVWKLLQQLQTTRNNIQQQGVQLDAIEHPPTLGVVGQQCCVRLPGALRDYLAIVPIGSDVQLSDIVIVIVSCLLQKGSKKSI